MLGRPRKARRFGRAVQLGSLVCSVLATGACLALGPLLAPATALAGEPPQAPVTESCIAPHSLGGLPVCGTLNLGASAYHFAYNLGMSCLGGWSTPDKAAPESQGAQVREELSGLEGETQYSFCLVATNAFGETVGNALFVETPAAPPSVPVTEACPGSQTAGSTLQVCGTLNPYKSARVGYYFAYNAGSSCLGGKSTEAGPEVEGQGIHVTGELTGLDPGTKYTYCVVATNRAGATTGNRVEFATEYAAPSVDGESAGAVTQTAATLDAEINPNGVQTIPALHYSTDPSLSDALQASGTPLEAAFGEQAVSLEIAGLAAGTTYYYRVVATHSGGSVGEGPIESFTTAPASTGGGPSPPQGGGTQPPSGGPTAALLGKTGAGKSLRNAQKLARALRACQRQPRRRRASCRARARRLYGAHSRMT